MNAIRRYVRILVSGVQFLCLASLALALPPANGLLEVDVPMPFAPNPAFVDQNVKAVFAIYIKDNTLRQEAQRFGIEKQTLTVQFKDDGGTITRIRLVGTTLTPGGVAKTFDHVFKDLRPGESQILPSAALTVTLSKAGDDLVVEGGKNSPNILRVEPVGRFETPGDKVIFLHAAIQPQKALQQAVGQADTKGKVQQGSIVGPKVVPSFSQYKYETKDAKAGDKILWEITNDPKNIAEIRGAKDKAEVLVILHAAKNEAGANVWKLWVIKDVSFSR